MAIAVVVEVGQEAECGLAPLLLLKVEKLHSNVVLRLRPYLQFCGTIYFNTDDDYDYIGGRCRVFWIREPSQTGNQSTNVFQPNFPCSTAFLIGFWSGWMAPLFSSLSNNTKSFSASLSFSSSVISGTVAGCWMVPVMGLISAPVLEVDGPYEALDEVDDCGGGFITPLLNRKPATFP